MPEPEDTAADKWLTSLRKSVSRSLTYFTRTATRALLKVLRSGSYSPDQAKPGVCPYLHMLNDSALDDNAVDATAHEDIAFHDNADDDSAAYGACKAVPSGQNLLKQSALCAHPLSSAVEHCQ